MGEVIRLRVASSEAAITLQGAAGSLAVEAVSPRVSFERTPNGSWMNVTDVDGEKTTFIPDGVAGPTGPAGETGPQGDDYVLTADDKNEIAALVMAPEELSAPVLDEGAVIISTRGTTTSKTGFNASDYVDVSGWYAIRYKRLKNMSNQSNYGMAFYDASRVYVFGIGSPSAQPEYGYDLYEAQVPDGAVYARFTMLADTETFGAFEVYGLTQCLWELGRKQDALTFDNAPSAYSDNPVKSSGIKAAIDAVANSIPTVPTKVSDLIDDSGHYTKPAGGIPASDIASGVIPDISGKQDALTFDSAPAPESSNPVTSNGVYNSVNGLKIDLEADIGLLESTVNGHTNDILDLNVNKANKFRVTNVSGTDPTIQADSDHRYVCGTLNTLTLYPNGLGVTDVVFKSGTTPTVLNVIGSVKWPDWFDPSALEASVTYEINILDGEFGAVGKWT